MVIRKTDMKWYWGEGEGGMFQENSIETCILSRVKQPTILIYYLFCFIFFMQIFMYAWYLSIQKVSSFSLYPLSVYNHYSIILTSFTFPW